MSSSAPGGSFGRVFGLHGKGSDGSRDVLDADEVEETFLGNARIKSYALLKEILDSNPEAGVTTLSIS